MKCWVCKKPHRVKDHHSKDEISEAFDKKRAESPNSAMLVEDVSDFCMEARAARTSTANEI
mgnify:CR=1 FL=1